MKPRIYSPEKRWNGPGRPFTSETAKTVYGRLGGLASAAKTSTFTRKARGRRGAALKAEKGRLHLWTKRRYKGAQVCTKCKLERKTHKLGRVYWRPTSLGRVAFAGYRAGPCVPRVRTVPLARLC